VERNVSGEIETIYDTRDKGVVAFVTIDNRAKLNALNSQIMDAFVQAIETAAQKARVIVIAGAGGKSFVGGADILEMSALDSTGARAFITRVHKCCDAVRRAPVPVIAKIDGHCYGAGLELAASCDIRIASTDARFGMQEVALGIPSVVEAAVLPQLIGWGRTRDILLTGEIFGANEAARWGLVERLVEPMMLRIELEKVLNALLANGPNALRLQKKLITQWETLPLPQAVQAGIDAFEEAFGSDEAQKMLGHFVAERNKRKAAQN
jgi:enoyl-CoA hydratase/carnithine racemase